MCYMKSNESNLYKQNGNFYVKAIKRCYVLEKKGGDYCLECKIKQLGEKEYNYIAGGDFLEYDVFSYGGAKKLWLSEDAKNFLADSIAEFNGIIEGNVKSGEKFCCENCGDYVIRYRRTSLIGFETIKELKINGIIRYVHKTSVSFDYFFLCGHTRPQDNVLYTKAVQENDLYVKYSIENLCGMLTKEGRLYLESVDGIKRLPYVKKCLDQKFYVRYEDGIWDSLYASKYGILHRPYFAMMGSTRSVIELNPYTKTGVDATKKSNAESGVISFREFCDMCEENAME